MGSPSRSSPLSKDTLVRIGHIVFLSVKDFMKDSGPQWAAAVAYYALLSSFPLMLALVSIGSYFVDEQWVIQQGTEMIGELLPEGEQQVEEIVQEAVQARGSVGVISIGLLLWSGSRVFGVLARALNIAFDVDEFYGFVKRTAIELVMAVSIGLLFVVALASRYIISVLRGNIQVLQGNDNAVASFLTDMIPPVLLSLTIFVIYLFVPRRKVKWYAALAGAIVATLLFAAGRPLFWQYINRFAEYHLIYGSLAIMIIIVFWSWLVAVFLLLGGEVAGHVQDLVVENKTVEQVEKRHKARSPLHAGERLEALLPLRKRSRLTLPQQLHMRRRKTSLGKPLGIARGSEPQSDPKTARVVPFPDLRQVLKTASVGGLFLLVWRLIRR